MTPIGSVQGVVMDLCSRRQYGGADPRRGGHGDLPEAEEGQGPG
ncbi:MAG TPA: hypothetical protein PLR78_16775 [Polaromonas sp.]|nr:hypothetical protein [Polaromonas sp.]HQS33430.1 hypothetical protein [Polaromonas sp.]